LKNKLAEAIASNDLKMAKVYVSTTYAILFFLVVVFILVFIVANQFISWTGILSVPAEMENELSRLMVIIFCFFCMQFVLQTIVVILTAFQSLSMASFLGFLGSLLSLAIIYFLTKTTTGSLLYLGVAFSISPLIVFAIASIFYFKTKFKAIAPSYKSIDFSYSKTLMGLGIKFFIIQVAAIVLYQTTNLIIARLQGPAEVTSYNIAYKYFGIITMAFTIIMGPFWVAFSDAYFKKDIVWIQATIKKLLYVWIFTFFGGLLMLLLSTKLIGLWVGKDVPYDFQVGLAMFLYFITSAFGSIFVFFINGTGKVFVQFLSSIITPIIFIPLALLLGKHFGQVGIIYTSIACNFFGIIVAPVQYNLIIKGRASGLWNK
jgi:O-antigen/teichoic acid export membrane protein